VGTLPILLAALDAPCVEREVLMALAAALSFSKAKVGVLETGEVGEADDTGDCVVEILTAPSATVRATVGSSRNRSNFCAI
jgi:hypothetical protein